MAGERCLPRAEGRCGRCGVEERWWAPHPPLGPGISEHEPWQGQRVCFLCPTSETNVFQVLLRTQGSITAQMLALLLALLLLVHSWVHLGSSVEVDVANFRQK